MADRVCTCREGFDTKVDFLFKLFFQSFFGAIHNLQDEIILDGPFLPSSETFFPVLIDDDECAVGNAGCDHICNNTHGSYYCSCHHGYSLDTNSKTCTGKILTMHTSCICGSKGRRQGGAPSWWSKFFHFHAVFGKKNVK